jgi:type VII secretion integral membrane protein EccD
LIESSATAEPELCRVSVIGGNTQVDVGLPATVPIAAFIGDLVALVESRNPDLSESEEGAPLETQHWTLARLGRDAISPHETLTEAEVFDGELLVLRAVAAAENPALFDDVIDAVARLTESAFPAWGHTSARWAGLVAAIAATLGAVGLLWMSKAHGQAVPGGCVAAAVGVLALVAATLAARMYAEELAATVLSWCGLALIFIGSALLVPEGMGSANLLLGCAVTLVVATIAYRVTGVGATMFTTVITVAVFGLVCSGLILAWHFPGMKVGAGVVVAAVLMVSAAPRIAVAAARLPVPPVPTAGGAIDPADHEPRPTIEGIGAIGATAIPSAAGLGRRARAANQYQSGLIIGASVAGFAGAIAAAEQGDTHRWQGMALAAIVGVILCLRGRAFADITQAGALVGFGCLTLVSLGVGMGLGDRHNLVAYAGGLLVFAVAAMFFGVVGPHTDVSPVVRRFGELLEYLLIILIVPLVFWIMDLYGIARDI